ncbi:unnamed protein product, partial [Callosobruchus maculatus]
MLVRHHNRGGIDSSRTRATEVHSHKTQGVASEGKKDPGLKRKGFIKLHD